jgi:phosphatidylethanolamine/phosphatidyl-N-methylethanolamine N-methyltransferase
VSLRNDFVERVYASLAGVYDIFFGLALQPGRRVALARMALRPGMRLLEVGVGTGLSALMYPPDVKAVGVDLSAPMLEQARRRLGEARRTSVTLCRADALRLPFADGVFDVVFAPYVMNAVPDAIGVAREMQRVCRPGGRIVLLNHFRSQRTAMQRVEHLVSPLLAHLGFTWDLDMPTLISGANLHVEWVEGVNIPRFSSLVMCRAVRPELANRRHVGSGPWGRLKPAPTYDG